MSDQTKGQLKHSGYRMMCAPYYGSKIMSSPMKGHQNRTPKDQKLPYHRNFRQQLNQGSWF